MASIGFIPASEQDFFTSEAGEESAGGSQTSRGLSGLEVRQFYENLTKDGSEGQHAPEGREHRGERPKRKSSSGARRRTRARTRPPGVQREPSSTTVQRGTADDEGRGASGRAATAAEASGSEMNAELQGLRFLRCAQEGDLSVLKELLSKGVDINFQDHFFWTAVMCASWSGQRAAVRLLLRHGAAWVGVVDTQGRDAKDLALEAGHNEVLAELESYGRSPQQDTNIEDSDPQAQWCGVCASEYSGSQSSHLSSTLHQFSLKHPSPSPLYCLPASSNSYRMMVRCGWKPGTGLGPEGEGPRQPVATVLKRDQQGLGYGPDKRAKVTHFRARDRDAVKLPSKDNKEKRERGKRKQEKNERDWERDFRNSFYL